jgi:hypothetical protein
LLEAAIEQSSYGNLRIKILLDFHSEAGIREATQPPVCEIINTFDDLIPLWAVLCSPFKDDLKVFDGV